MSGCEGLVSLIEVTLIETTSSMEVAPVYRDEGNQK